MNEDEAFIRAIVDAPGDDLRAEREAVESGNAARLRELAAGLDPVWVARVSMPPVGVCLRHVDLIAPGPRLTESEIASAERRLRIQLPPEYRAFLQNYNGGVVDATRTFDTPDGPLETHKCWWGFNSLGDVEESAAKCATYFQTNQTEPEIVEWLSHFVFVGHDPDMIGAIILGVTPPDSGHVWIYDASSDLVGALEGYHSGRLPHSIGFPSFLERLPNYPPS